MNTGLTYRPITEADEPRIATLLAQSFSGTTEQTQGWIARSGRDRFRAVCRGGAAPEACLLIADIGQHFGGRAVSMEGVAGVAVAPESRGHGVGAHMMRSALLDMHRRGVALSTLYPATQVLYRRVGYEQAGFCNIVRLNAASIGASRDDRRAAVRPVAQEDWPRIEAAYREAYASVNGSLERRSYIWDRVRSWRGDKTAAWCIDEGGSIEAVVALLQRPDSREQSGRHEVFCTALHAFTERGARRLLAFLQDYSSMASDIVFYCAPNNPLLFLLPEQRWHHQSFGETWMTRIVDVAAALEQRGYPAGLSARLSLEITDDLIESNNGVFTLEVAGGRAGVRRGPSPGAPNLSMSVGDLVPIYSALHTPIAMARLGRVKGDEGSLALAESIFASSTPGMEEHF